MANKSPKGHWLLIWVQWTLLLRVRFLANQKAWLPHLWNQSKHQTIAIFQFRIHECIRYVAVAFRSEERVLWRKGLSLTYFCATCHVCIRNLCHLFGSMFSQYNWIPVVINYTCSVASVSSYLSSLHTLEPHIQVHQLCTNNKHNTTLDPPLGGSGWKA